MEKILFNYYPADIKKTKPIGIVNLKQLINAIKNPKPEIKNTIYVALTRATHHCSILLNNEGFQSYKNIL